MPKPKVMKKSALLDWVKGACDACAARRGGRKKTFFHSCGGCRETVAALRRLIRESKGGR